MAPLNDNSKEELLFELRKIQEETNRRYELMERRITDRENVFSNHQHSGSDGSKVIENEDVKEELLEEIRKVEDKSTMLTSPNSPLGIRVADDEVVLFNHNHGGYDRSRMINQEIVVTAIVEGLTAATATNYGKFFVAQFPCTVIEITEIHGIAGTDAGAVTLNIERLTGTQALDAGVVLLTTAFDLKASINVVRTGALAATNDVNLNIGDRLALKDTGALTSVADIIVVVKLRRNINP